MIFVWLGKRVAKLYQAVSKAEGVLRLLVTVPNKLQTSE